MNNIYNYTIEQLEEYFVSIGEKNLKQFKYLIGYIKRVTSFDLMTNIKKK